MERYEDRLSSINSLQQGAVLLNKKLNYLGNHATVKNAKDVAVFANGLALQLDMLSDAIPQDLRARRVTLEEYEILSSELENARSLLNMLGVEG